jgi:DNA polymerase elongation subunit (family B)
MVKFQILDWSSYHERDKDDYASRYTIRLFGRTKDKRIYLRVDGFTPYFFVEIPKTWKKMHVDLFMNEVKSRVEYKFRGLLESYSVVQRKRFYGFTNDEQFSFIRLVFNDIFTFRAYEKILRNKIHIPTLNKNIQPQSRTYQLYESNIEPYLRCAHIRNLKMCGWVTVDDDKLEDIEDEGESICDLNYSTHWSNLNACDDDSVAKFVIAAFDIECTSGDGHFPQAIRPKDKVIQIGTTFSYYGEEECFYRHLVTLGTCDKINDADVEVAETEDDLLIKWKNMIERKDPDILVGYNIFGFDEKYMADRAELLGCTEFMELNRISGTECELKEKKLASSALGENILHYFDMVGRVQIDLMKVIQREYRLPAYKLDYVAGYFISEEITGCEFEDSTIIIKTKKTKGLRVGNYIGISYDDGITVNTFGDSNKSKFRIEKLTGDEIHISINDYLFNDLKNLVGKNFKLRWAQVKDDVKPREIFQLQKGSSKDRKKIGEYCLQDCALCNRLLDKLQILNNTIGMANVCSVPLSYLFMRGQGIKGHSLVAKKCRENQYLIPVIQKPRPKPGEEEEKGSTYDGALCIDPTPGIYFNPISVLDYSSLYPKSMIHRNLSHECFVNDPKYDNLKGYFYYQITIKNNDGTVEKCKFARKITGELGIIPQILKELLDAREKTKDRAKVEKDSFKKNILDGLQLSYKITANSLYGILGSDVSPLYLRQIAASTCKTGRELLQFACKVVKENYADSKIIYGDSISKDEPVLLMNKNEQIEIKEIQELSDKWVPYENYKNENTIEYFENILKCLIKSNDDIFKIKKQTYDNHILVSEYSGGKYTGHKYMDKKRKYYKCKVVGKGKIPKGYTQKYFYLASYSEEDAKKLVDESIIQINNQYGLTRNQYRKWFDPENKKEYLEVKLNGIHNKTMLCDIEDIDLIEKYMWHTHHHKKVDMYYASTNTPDKQYESMHNLVLQKVLSQLPKKLHKEFKNMTVDHINNDTLDNRKINLRFATGSEQAMNMKKSIYNRHSGVGKKLDRGHIRWRVRWYNENGKRIEKYFKTKPDALEGVKTIRKNLLISHDTRKQQFIEKLMDIIKEDMSDRTEKSQAKTDYKVYTDEGWKPIKRVIRHKTNKKMYRISTLDSIIDVTEDHSLIDEHGDEISPKDCVVGTRLLHGIKIKKLSKSLVDKYKDLNLFECSNKKECMEYYCVSKLLGYNVFIQGPEQVYDQSKINQAIQKESDNKYHLIRTKNKIEHANMITKIEVLSNKTDYVYDLETENSRFQAGIGSLIVHNTDSIFIDFGLKDKNGKPDTSKEALKKSIELGQEAAKKINERLPHPQRIIYEKCFYPFCIISKKRYVGNLYGDDTEKYYQKSMGIVLKRRDNANIVKDIVGGIVDKIMNKRDIESAIKFVKKELINILNNKYPLEKFIITKTLRDKYKEKITKSGKKTEVAHKVLADRISTRDPGNKPMSGDRIPFVYTRVDKKGIEPKDISQGKRIEHPDYIRENNLKIDYLFYITNQIMIPALQFLELCIKNPEKIFKQAIMKEQNRRKGVVSIDNFFNKSTADDECNDDEPFEIKIKSDLKHVFENPNKNEKKRSPIKREKKRTEFHIE